MSEPLDLPELIARYECQLEDMQADLAEIKRMVKLLLVKEEDLLVVKDYSQVLMESDSEMIEAAEEALDGTNPLYFIEQVFFNSDTPENWCICVTDFSRNKGLKYDESKWNVVDARVLSQQVVEYAMQFFSRHCNKRWKSFLAHDFESRPFQKFKKEFVYETLQLLYTNRDKVKSRRR